MSDLRFTSPVETEYGPIRGMIENGVQIFLGIPYAAPPVGSLRFLAPQPCTPWNEVRDTVKYGNKCYYMNPPGLPQEKPDPNDPKNARYYAVDRINTGNMVDEGPFSEDCLYLNIWTPTLDPSAELPVLVWVHGGGYSTGSGEAEWFDGQNMANKHHAIVVTLNHRLNIFGFLDLGWLAPDKFPDSGNAGLLDVIEAFRWVRDNIRNFGGSPHKVMIFGESGGGGKINTLLAMPKSKGLYQTAISMSGPTRFNWGNKTHEVTMSILNTFGLEPDEVERLQEFTPEELLEASSNIRVPGFGLTYVPVIDDRNIFCDPTSPESVSVNPDVTYMIGTTHDDSRLWIGDYEKDVEFDENELKARMVRVGYDPAKLDEAIAAAKEGYSPEPTPGNLYYSMLQEIYFRGIARQVADLRSDAGCKVYFYQFDRETPNPDCKAAHGAELPFFFDNLAKAPYIVSEDDSACAALAHKIAETVVRFAGQRDPNGGDLPVWPSYNSSDIPIMVFKNGGAAEVEQDHLGGIRRTLDYYPGSIGLP